MHRDNEAVNCVQKYWTGTYQVLPLHQTELFCLHAQTYSTPGRAVFTSGCCCAQDMAIKQSHSLLPEHDHQNREKH